MNLLGSFVIACSMYSKIPMPQISWTKERMKYVMCFFPVVGVLQAVLIYGFAQLTWTLELWKLYYAGGVVLPLIVNGGIHMDGYLDVVDARASYGDKDKKLNILQDPHVGAFAIIGCVIYMLIYLAAFIELPREYLPALGAVYVLTRALSGLSIVLFPKAKTSGLAAAFSDDAQKQIVTITMSLYIIGALGWIIWVAGLTAAFLCAVASFFVYFYYYRVSCKDFGGITGDLAGYFLQICELVLLFILIIAFRL